MEIKIDKRKIDNSHAKYEKIEKVINGDEKHYYTNIYINTEKSFEFLTKKVNYNEFYKQYINQFDELDKYAYYIAFPHLKKEK